MVSSPLYLLAMLYTYKSWLRVYRKSVTLITVSIWYSLDSFNSSLKAFGVIVMNRKVPGKERFLCKVGFLF